MEARKPFDVLLACASESVLPNSENGPENESVLMAPAPLPMRMPEGVVEPVPPLPTPRAVARFKVLKDANCEKRFVLLAVVEKKFVEVALVSVVLPLKVEVALKVLMPEKVLLVVVENAVENTPVDELNASGKVADKEDEASLLLSAF